MVLQESQSMVRIGLFTGSFDPLTKGHLEIIRRGAKLFDKLYVGVFDNPEKRSTFTTDERLAFLKQNLLGLKEVEVIKHHKELTVNIAKELGVTVLLRSLRSAQDFDYEANMIYFNREMTGVETVLLVSSPSLSMISSSRVKELASFGMDVSSYVPKNVNEKLKEKYGK